MRKAAQGFQWLASDFEKIRANARALPGQAAVSWRNEFAENEAAVRAWAEELVPSDLQNGQTFEIETQDKDLAELERKLLDRKPAVRERVSKSIERGNIGTRLKRDNGFRCQLCDALGVEALGFLKADGEYYVEAHHATPVSAMEIGSLSATNIMIVCANHHRQMHYGSIILRRTPTKFIVALDGKKISIQRFGISG
jgi:predicted HNH restriction endonuclease